jgi:hypothetical protein
MEAVDDGAARRLTSAVVRTWQNVVNGVSACAGPAAGALRRCYLALPDRPMQLHGAGA